MTFDMWWVEEVGHPPADAQERFAFELARKAWDYAGENFYLGDNLEAAIPTGTPK